MKKLFSFKSAGELIDICKQNKLKIDQAVVNYTILERGMKKQDIIDEMHRRVGIVRETIEAGLKDETRSGSGLSGGDAVKFENWAEKSILGEAMTKALTYSFAIMEQNAKFRRIVAFPTAGSAGTVPASLFAAVEVLDLSEKELVNAIITATGVGMITGENTCLAGARGGCQAEVGTASAMAAAALTQLRGGSVEDCFNAAAIALKGLLGLVCDPIAGLVEAPCVKRNATAIANAFMASEITLAGVKSNVDYDEALVAMSNVAKHMANELKETAKGGLAITKCAQDVESRIYQN